MIVAKRHVTIVGDYGWIEFGIDIDADYLSELPSKIFLR